MIHLVLDAVRAARERLLASGLGVVAVLAFMGGMATILARSDSEGTALKRSLESEASRVLEVRAGGDTPTLPSWFATTVDEFDTVEGVVSLGPVSDVDHSETGRGPLPLWSITGGGELLGVGRCDPRLPVAVLDDRALGEMGLSVARGALVERGGQPPGRVLAIGGSTRIAPEWNRPVAAYTTCSSGLDEESPETITVLVLVENLSDVSSVTSQLRSVIQPIGRGVSVISDADVIRFRNDVAVAAVDQRRRNLVTVTTALLGVSLLIGVVMGIARKPSFGRLRALGATRADLALLVWAETTTVALVAVSIGSLAIVTAQASVHPWQELSWLPWLGILALILAGVGTLPAVVLASLTDPVKVLRQP